MKVTQTELLRCRLCGLDRCSRYHAFPPCASLLPGWNQNVWSKVEKDSKKRKRGSDNEKK